LENLDNDLVGVLPLVKRKDARASSHSSYECVAKTMYGVGLKYLGAVRRFFSRVLPSNTISIEALKQDVWSDLSAVYHKYEDDYQKRAFREIIYEISERLNEDKWNNVYKKLHITNQRNSMLHRLV